MKSMWAIVLAAAVGCAGGAGQTKKDSVTVSADDVAAAFNGALTGLTSAVSSLSRIVESSQIDLPKTYQAYVGELKTLDGRVEELRRMAIDIAARRDVYLQHWVEKTQGISTPELKARAEKRRADLTQDFQVLAGKGQAVRRAFGPLHLLMGDIALYLEADLTTATVQGLKPELDSVRTQNIEVQKLAEDYKKSLAEIRAKLATPAAPAPAK